MKVRPLRFGHKETEGGPVLIICRLEKVHQCLLIKNGKQKEISHKQYTHVTILSLSVAFVHLLSKRVKWTEHT